MSFSPPVVGCFLTKGLQKGGSRVPQDPPSYAPVIMRNDANFHIKI